MKTHSLAKDRELVTKRLAGLELPDAFKVATVAASVQFSTRKAQYAKASRERLARKACRVVGSL